MATLACADVSLDPLYFGGGNSSCEALAQGIPLVTLPGTHAYGRLSLALCQEMNELRGIASSVDDYVDRAVDLANHAERHAMRQDIAERARARAREILETHVPTPLPEGVAQEMAAIIADAERELGVPARC